MKLLMKIYQSNLYALLIIALSVIWLLSSCSTDAEKIQSQQYKVEKIISGNKVELSLGLEVILIGVSKTNQGYRYLEKEIMGHNVRIKLDSKDVPKFSFYDEEIYAYLYLDGICVNAEMLKKGVAELNKVHLNDELQSFSNIEIQEPEGIKEETNEKLAYERHISYWGSIASITALLGAILFWLIKKIKKSKS